MKTQPTFRILFLLPLILFSTVLSFAQDELGLPKITNYTYNEYNAHQQNWWIVEDKRGIMYFANGDGVLEFDGENWNLIKIYGGSRSLVLGDDGIIYVGVGSGELGYLETLPNGELSYASLKDKIPEEHKEFADVWEVDNYRGKIYYRTSNIIFVWDGETMEAIPSEDGYHVGKVVQDIYYQRIWGVGLCYLDDDNSFQLVPNGEFFASKRIYQILPYKDDQLFIATRENGFYLYDGKKFTPFESPVYDDLKGEVYLPGLALGDGKFVINSFNRGLHVMDESGRSLQSISTSTGLQDNSVTYVYQDSRGVLWLALFNGLASIDINSNVTSFGPEFGIPGRAVFDVTRHNGILYAGTNNGIYYFDKSANSFKPIQGSFGQTYSLLKSQGRLLAGTGGMGLIEIIGDRYRDVRRSVDYDYRVAILRKSKIDTNRIYAVISSGDNPGIASLYYDASKQDWMEESRTSEVWPGFDGFEEDINGDIWSQGKTTGSIDRIIPHIENNKLDFAKSTFHHYGASEGLDSSIFYGVWQINDKIQIYKFQTAQTLEYNEEEKRFENKINAFPGQIDTITNAGSIPLTDHTGKFWLASGKHKYIGKTSSEGIEELNTTSLIELSSIPTWRIYPEESNTEDKTVAWFSGPDGLYRYEGNLEAPEIPNFRILLRNVTVNGDSTIFAGAGTRPEYMELDHSSNTVKFNYAAPFFIEDNNVEYQTMLEGFDKKWSEPTKKVEKEYINLPKGDYTFKVKAVNAYNSEAQELTVPFTVNPPWYTSWWAYLLYAIGAFGLVRLIVKQRTQNLLKQQTALEEKVKERTQEVESRLDELATVNRVSKAITEKIDMDELIQYVGDQMRDLFKANIAYLAIHNQKNNLIDFPYQYGDNMDPMKYGEGLTSKIIKTGTPLLINKDLDKTYTTMGISPTGKSASSYLGVPIPVENEVIGVLSVQSTEQFNRFNDNDKRESQQQLAI